MATKAQIEVCLKNAVDAFNRAIDCGQAITENIRFEILSSGNYETILNEITDSLGAFRKEYSSQTVSELVVGTSKMAVVIYGRRFTPGLEGEKVIAHELGHALDAIYNNDIFKMMKVASESQLQVPFSIGGSFWSEFIAAVIANYVYRDNETVYDLFTYNAYITKMLDDAIHSPVMNVPLLGAYFAGLLSDPTSLIQQAEDELPLVGMGNCDEDEIDKLLDISDILIPQIEDERPFWKVRVETLVMIGNAINELFDLLAEKGIMN